MLGPGREMIDFVGTDKKIGMCVEGFFRLGVKWGLSGGLRNSAGNQVGGFRCGCVLLGGQFLTRL